MNQDYAGSKEQEQDVTDQTQVKLDYSARSLIFNLQTDAENISKIELTPATTGHRVPVEQLEIYYKQRENDFAYSKLERSAWSGVKDNQGRITIQFKPVLKAHLLKIHCNYDDLDLFQMPLDRSEFYNSPEKLVTVYQKLISRTESYQYDAMGNRKTEKILLRKEYGYTYTYGPRSNRLMSKVKDDGSVKCDYTYDENGNLTTKVVTKENTVDTWEYAYDLLNQLEQVKKNGVIVSSYVYDPNGFRVEKDGSQGRIDYVPLLNGEVGYRKEFGSSKEYSFIYTGGQHLARVNGVIGDDNAKKFYYHNDHQGSALAVTDENGNKVVERDFTPFGERINTDIYDETERDVDEDDSGFTGKDWDGDIGLYYYNARWYDPEVGRFTTEDSETDPNNPNEYAYCYDNPVNNIDPTGHFNVSVARGTALISSSINALSALNPNAGKALSAFNTLLSVCSAVKSVEDFYLNHVVKNYTKTSSWSAKTDIPGVSYSETSTKTVIDGKSQSDTLAQKFENKDKNTSIEITTTSTADGRTNQYYTITMADEVKIVPLEYGKDGVADIIGVEGFTSDPTFGAIMIATTQKDGAVFALAGSSKPNVDQETGQPKGGRIVDTDTFGRPYEMTYGTHNGFPALVLEGGKAIQTIDENPNQNYQNFATEIMIHYGYTNTNRGSLGCQTIRPGSVYGYKDKLNYTGYNDYIDFMKSVIPNNQRKEGTFVGYYYLERL